MKLLYSSRFEKDLRNIVDASAKADIAEALTLLKSATMPSEIPNLKKMQGAKNAFRVKAGEFRLGFYMNGDTISLARCVNRKDIYKSFP